MYPVNSRFHELATSGSPTTRCRIYFIDDSVDCTDDNDVQTNGTLLVRDPGDTDSNRRISGDNGVVFSDLFNSDKNIVIGATVSKPVQIALLNLDGGLNSFDFGRCKIYVDVYDTDNAAWLPCPMGVYIIDTPTKLNTKVVNASGYDQMQKLDKTADAWWNNIDWTNGVTVSELISQIATECGVSVIQNLSANILNGSNAYTTPPFTANKTTYRDILGKLAGITGTIAYFDRDGALDMRWFEYAELSSTTETLTGNPVSFVSGGDSSIDSLTVPFSPIQDLNGYDHPWPAGGGKNLLNIPDSASQTAKGVTWRFENGLLYINGAATAGQTLFSVEVTYPSDVYTFSAQLLGGAISGVNSSFNGYTSGNSREWLVSYGASGASVSMTKTNDIAIINAFFNNGTVFNNAVIGFQVERGSSMTTFAPYSNICPISGRTGLSVYVSPTTAQADATTYAVDWTSETGTVYGGTVDVVTGELVATYGMVDLGTFGWTKSSGTYGGFYATNRFSYRWATDTKMLCSRYKFDGVRVYAPYYGDNGALTYYFRGNTRPVYEIYITDESLADKTASEFRTEMSGVQLCYELANPITYQLTAQEVELLVGQNYVWSDTGEDVTAAIATRNIVTVDADALGSGVMSLDIAEYAVTAIDMLEVLPLDPDLDVSIGTGDNIYQLAGNPFLVGADADEVETLATPIYDRLKTVVPYKPLDMRLITDWSLESGDVIRAIIDGNTVVLPIMQQTMTWRGGYVLSDMQSSGDAERPGMDWQERTTYQNDVQMHEFANTVNELLSRIQDMTGNYSLIQQTVSAIEQTVSSQGTTIQSILDPTGQIWTAIKTNSADLSDLEDALNGEISERKSYIRFLPAEPAIVLGVDTGNEIKLKLVNNIIYFFNGSDDSTDLSLAYAYFNNEEAGADRFVATQSVQIGNSDSASRWLFKTLSNGDLILDMV